MKTLATLLILGISFSSFSLSKKFIRSIDKIELSFDQNKVWRGNVLEMSLDVFLIDGSTHNCNNSSKINLKDFDFHFTGNGEIVSQRKRKLLVRFNNELTTKSFISATLKKDETHSYIYDFNIKDFRGEVHTIEAITSPKAVYPRNEFYVDVLSTFKDGSNSKLSDNYKKLLAQDFNYKVEGCGTLLNDKGLIKVQEGYQPKNNTLIVTAALKNDPSISYTKTYTKHFNTTYFMAFDGSSPFAANDGKRDMNIDGQDGKNYDDNYTDGESGTHGRDGAPGFHGLPGESGSNLNVYMDLIDSTEIIEVTIVNPMGQKFVRFIGKEGEMRIQSVGGSGGKGGDGRDGGDGGDGGRGNTSETKEADLRGNGGNGGSGGNGGWGGNGGIGGKGGDVTIFYTKDAAPFIKNIVVLNVGGDGGRGGCEGRAGDAGDGGSGGLGDGNDGVEGVRGRPGRIGPQGRPGFVDYVRL